MVHETIFTSISKARIFIEDAIDAGRALAISLVYTNDPRINVRRMIDRAIRIGRTVPVAFMAQTYVEVPVIIFKLHQEFGARIRVAVSDNSGNPDQVVEHNDIRRAVLETARYTKESCLKEMDDELRQIDKRNAIPANILYEAQLR